MARQTNDIERYLQGEMTPAEMHELEKQALADPFLSEALDGANQAGTDGFLFDLKELRRSFKHRSRTHEPHIISIWRWSLGIAAGLVLLAISSVYIIVTINQNRKDEQAALTEVVSSAKPKEPVEKKAQADSVTLSQQLSLNRVPPRQILSSDNRVIPRNRKSPTPQGDTQPAITDTDSEPNSIESVRPIEVVEEAPQPVSETEIAVDAARSRKASTASVSHIIRGKVTSEEDGVGLPGVNILVKGTSRGTVTNMDGSYEIALDAPNQKLVFAFIGYKTIEMAANDKSELNIQLKNDNLQLSEVVVTGMGASRSPAAELAGPRGGRDAFKEYLKDNLRYPQTALHNNVEGRVTVQFTVDPNGQLKDFKVLKGIGAGCEEELIRLIKEGPTWSPTKQNSLPVSDKVKVRFKFDIPQ